MNSGYTAYSFDPDSCLFNPSFIIEGETVNKSEYKTPAHYMLESAYEILYKYYRPPKKIHVGYSNHQLYLNPYLQVKYLCELMRMFVTPLDDPNLTKTQKQYIINYRDKFGDYQFSSNKLYKLRASRMSKSNKPKSYDIIHETIYDVYSYHNSFNLECIEEWDEYIEQLHELLDVYDSELTLKKIIDTTVKIHSPRDKPLSHTNSVANEEDLNEFKNCSTRLCNALLEFQMTLPSYIYELLLIYASYLLVGFKFASVELLKHPDSTVTRYHTYHVSTRKEYKALPLKQLTINDIYTAVDNYFGVTLNLDFKLLWDITPENQITFYVPYMDFIESRSSFGKLIEC